MKKILIIVAILLFMQGGAWAVMRRVPTQYATIQAAVTASNNGDVVVVAPGTYSGIGNRDIDFGGKKITVQSQINVNNPSWSVIASTIIDCGGSRHDRHRAFYFHNGEDSSSKVLGFTIKNGFWAGAIGINGRDGVLTPVPYELTDPTGDPNTTPPYAERGESVYGDGYGGAIYCDGASPAIKYCVIENCTVTGGQGGDGALGQTPPPDSEWLWRSPWTRPEDPNQSTPDGQWGGHGGKGSGNGYGGAIACINSGSPVISKCVFSNNAARGGGGGYGGDGGAAVNDGAGGYESWGGGGGDASGYGQGGAIYCENGGNPEISDCNFANNIATQGTGGEGGLKGAGSALDPPAHSGSKGEVDINFSMTGGAVYYADNSTPGLTNCVFTDNIAYLSFYDYYDISTRGGALYSGASNTITLNNCDFVGNLGGAVYCDTGNVLNFYDCFFKKNTDTFDGGAIYISVGAVSVDIDGCTFSANSALDHGGAIATAASLGNVSNCVFSGNTADSDNNGTGYGGGIYAYRDGTTLTHSIDSCVFTGGRAVWGGGVYLSDFNADFSNCYFSGNTAEAGGGILAVAVNDGNLTFTGGVISGNTASGSWGGGGIYCVSSNVDIEDCVIKGNSATDREGVGGAINFDGGFATQIIKNCLFTDNFAGDKGGAVVCQWWAEPDILDCTFSANSAIAAGGAIFTDWSSLPVITDSIFNGCGHHAIHEEDDGGDALLTYCLFNHNYGGDYYDSQDQAVYTGAVQINSNVNGASHNIDGDPLFATGSLGWFYLSQIDAGQSSNSPALDAGSDTAANLGLSGYTTRTDDSVDAGQVDIGYHYVDSSGVGSYTLTTVVAGGQGTILVSPASGPYDSGTVVTLTAVPAPGWRVKEWIGTDDDASTSHTNTVAMIFNRTITVEFNQPRTITVGPNGDVPSINQGLYLAEDGDVIIVSPGIWREPSIAINKSVTIRSKDPNNPAATIIDAAGWVGARIIFMPDTDSDTVFSGFTIQNYRWGIVPRDDPEGCPGINGFDGWVAEGGAILIYPNASPVIKNCIIKDNYMRGGDGSNGCSAGPGNNAGRGGWGGHAYGGAIYCGPNSSPAFVNCQILNNQAVGGDGGDGGDQGGKENGSPNYGGNWSESGHAGAPVWDIDPRSLNIAAVYGPLWEVWLDSDGLPYIGNYRWYTAFGGGVFCDSGSTITFTGCTISGNRTTGGISGQGGLFEGSDQRMEPGLPYQLPSFGGGVYCADGSTIKFTNCTVSNNTADKPSGYYHLDPYLGFGGGVCAESTAKVLFADCIVSDNEASVGGGIYCSDSNLELADSVFTGNKAYEGGGLAGVSGSAIIAGCTVTGNEAFGDVTDPNGAVGGNDPNEYDPNNDYYLAGDGGGIHCDSTQAHLVDCQIGNNQAGQSGGGVYFSGSTTQSMNNCLLTANTAGRDGGGMAAAIYSNVTISNCTIADNIVSGTEFGQQYGGGLSSWYNANADVLNSIIWGNTASNGAQIAVSQGFEYEIGPAEVDVSYSDVQSGAVGVFKGSDCTIQWNYSTNLTGGTSSNPLFVEGYLGSYYLSQQPGGGDANSPCRNSGSAIAGSLGMFKHTTRIDRKPDTDVVDMGYHYVLTADVVGDYNFDGVVDFSDYAIFLEHWLDTGCDFPYWCEGMDLNEDGIVNNTDDALFKGNYGDEETMPPEPDPMTWSVAPVSAGTTSIKMTATTAYDNSGNTVRYYFECYSGDCNDSAWRTSPIYTDNTLSAGNEYGYRVRAIDQNYNAAYPHDPNNGGECIGCTDWSVVGYAKTGEIPPAAPSNLGATAVSSSQIDLSWTDNSSDETGFRIERKTSGGSYSLIADVAAGTTSFSNTGLAELTTYIYRVYAYNNIGNSDYSPEATATTMEYVEPPSAPSSLTATAVSSSQINLSWTDSSTNEDGFKIERKTGSGSYALIATVTAGTISYSNTGLSSATTYTYHVYAYNSGGNSGYSNEVSATTLTLDLTPPTPNPSTWATAPSKYLKNGTYWHKMVATTATDTTPPIYYYFDCLQSNGIDSGWQTSATYDYNTGFSSPVLCDYRVRTKDSLGNVGSWSEVKRTP